VVGKGLRVILLDLKLPKVDGLGVLKAVKGDPRTRSIPVVMLTSSRVPADIEACNRVGANSYIVKPVDYAGYTQVLKDLGLYWAQLNIGTGG
jgi:CheY-like chemotaxis protein